MRVLLVSLLAKSVGCYFVIEFIDEVLRHYKNMHFPSTIGMWITTVCSFLITFYSMNFPRVFLTLYITGMISYGSIDLIYMDLNLPKAIQNSEMAMNIKRLLKDGIEDPFVLILFSFLLALILVWILNMLQSVLIVVGFYVIYSMLFPMCLGEYRKDAPVIFYTLLIGSAMTLYYYLARNASKYVLMLMFCSTGSFLLLSSLEMVCGAGERFYDIVYDLNNMYTFELSSITFPMAVWIGLTIFAMAWQTRYI
ncbi:hypothetical protein HK407_03g05710 [Ordospora pajunii]|uniref:uncharacterized protein n=1 Tax=Ordospora pajunii TaxID=3039483 RepID=UPI00295286A0|nr:uncharacterized protein HK407_03g05710 [Ordospora pajunii]KAH9411821.1 hypothetical protein HK407_03g05710 [Ordospora pajunii]